MAQHVCPFWVGYLLLNPLRRLLENPEQLLGPYVREGLTVLEPGCGMGFFTLPLARMVGPEGRVVAVDLQPRMLAGLERRARKAGLSGRIEIRRAEAGRLNIDDLAGVVDFAAAIHIVHELPDAGAFFMELRKVLKRGGRVLVIEPKGHVSASAFGTTILAAQKAGFSADAAFGNAKTHKALFANA